MGCISVLRWAALVPIAALLSAACEAPPAQEQQQQKQPSAEKTAATASDGETAQTSPGVQTSAATSAATAAASSTGTTSTLTPASGARAAKIIFKQASPSGSFDAPASNGTVNAAGSGHQASRVFNADGTLLASGGKSASGWPKWLSGFEIGISGSNNSAAKNANCARFAATNEDTDTLCNWDRSSSTASTSCGAPGSLYRVSEFDCGRDTISTGTGGGSDGVYIRASFSRDTSYLSSWENILVVLEYASSTVHGSPAKPTSCFTNGYFDPTQTDCADMSWQIFMKHSASEVVQPFLLLAPPSLGTVDATNNRGGGNVGTKQFVMPLATDANLNTLQISRIRALTNDSSGSVYYDTCNGASNPSNSALCMGMVFYSITFYRI